MAKSESETLETVFEVGEVLWVDATDALRRLGLPVDLPGEGERGTVTITGLDYHLGRFTRARLLL